MSRVLGVRISGMSGSVGTGTKGLAFTIAVTSAIWVESTSCIRCAGLMSARVESSMHLVTPIMRSHTPPV